MDAVPGGLDTTSVSIVRGSYYQQEAIGLTLVIWHYHKLMDGEVT